MEVLNKNLSVYSALMKQDSEKVHSEYQTVEKNVSKMVSSYFEQKLNLDMKEEEEEPFKPAKY